MKALQPLVGRTFGRLTVLRLEGPGRRYRCSCRCGSEVVVRASSLTTGHTQSCGCYNKQRLSEVHTGRKYTLGRPVANKLDRTGCRYGKLTALKYQGAGRWSCRCDCGTEVSVLSTNLSHMAKANGGCRECGILATRKDITGERVGLLVAVSSDNASRRPLWTFKCDCGGSVQGTVREFHAQWLRSCGCHDNAHSSWVSMMSRCYDKKDVRYSSYGGRGIRVCERWHEFSKFIQDMGERPKRHNLGRKHAEHDYSLLNCFWEHISKNCRDTKNDGTPTRPGLRKGARPRPK